jgi:hypothetical protein
VKVFSFPLLIARSSTVPDTDALMSLLKKSSEDKYALEKSTVLLEMRTQVWIKCKALKCKSSKHVKTHTHVKVSNAIK